MRIALVTREYPPETSWGGIGTFYYSFADSLYRAGCDVEVFAQGIYKPSSEKLNGILVHRVLPRKWVVGGRPGGDMAGNRDLGVFAVSLSLEMYRTFSARHRQSRFDIVEGHEHLGINTLINMFHRNTVSTVTRYHTAYHSLVRRGLVDWPKSRIVNMLEKHSLSSADHRISASKFIDKITQEDFAGIPPADAVIPLNATLCPARATVSKEPLIVFVGRMVAGHKNPDMAARAFAALADRFPSWRIEFAGPDMPVGNGITMWQKCEKILAPYRGRFKYHGALSREQVNDLYARARISVIPSKFESFGLVALEAMAAGCVPVVASETALLEVVGEAGVTFINSSLEDLISQLSCLMADGHVLQNKSSAGVRRVHDFYSDSSITKLNLDFYQSAIRS